MYLLELEKKTETEFLKIIIQQLKYGKKTLDAAKGLTQQFLSLSPFNNIEDLKNKLQIFTHEHPEFQSIYITVLRIEEEKKTDVLLNKMQGYIKENKIDEALQLVK